jgi:hypothetical protein
VEKLWEIRDKRENQKTTQVESKNPLNLELKKLGKSKTTKLNMRQNPLRQNLKNKVSHSTVLLCCTRRNYVINLLLN